MSKTPEMDEVPHLHITIFGVVNHFVWPLYYEQVINRYEMPPLIQ